ncbi:nuclear transport factor 2 family protein [Limosilactobacillus sp. STM2_1]|uniref:Nuclear transport factor 2 family protein n=1 Tax=Limosilactobacillus rudii TaxID=2759755 RepID=A0A7W3UJB4_9LACO|nr:nuclear transport factor 2 family protein [Limosilactobacillus rudii]MBB1078477.1 nuclear transport factor 2 family protein [Limosilactobacillus rudii]MBB1096607.1 nuclear transport factor 2 family protein [Limosilactobacillus rudii]MCD7134197.1 nuclear transport factor 2 family protein [Limosilactobacillus rudii]
MTDKEEIIHLYRLENQAMVNQDITTLNRILAPTMQLQHMTGYVQPKLEWIDQIQNGEMKYYSSLEDSIKDIKITDDRASLTGQNQVKASIWGSAIGTWRLQMKMEFTKIAGQWLIANQIASTY